VKFSNRFQSGHFVVRVSTVSIWHGAFGARFGTVARTIERIQYYFTTVGFGPLRFGISVRRKKALRPVIRARNVFGVRYIRVKFPLAKSELLLVRVGADDVGEFFFNDRLGKRVKPVFHKYTVFDVNRLKINREFRRKTMDTSASCIYIYRAEVVSRPYSDFR